MNPAVQPSSTALSKNSHCTRDRFESESQYSERIKYCSRASPKINRCIAPRAQILNIHTLCRARARARETARGIAHAYIGRCRSSRFASAKRPGNAARNDGTRLKDRWCHSQQARRGRAPRQSITHCCDSLPRVLYTLYLSVLGRARARSRPCDDAKGGEVVRVCMCVERKTRALNNCHAAQIGFPWRSIILRASDRSAFWSLCCTAAAASFGSRYACVCGWECMCAELLFPFARVILPPRTRADGFDFGSE